MATGEPKKTLVKDHDEKLWEMTSPQHVPYPYNPYMVYLPTFGWLSMVIKCRYFLPVPWDPMGIWIRNFWVPYSSIPNSIWTKEITCQRYGNTVLAEKNAWSYSTRWVVEPSDWKRRSILPNFRSDNNKACWNCHNLPYETATGVFVH